MTTVESTIADPSALSKTCTPIPGSPDPLIFDSELHDYFHAGLKMTGVSKLISNFKRPFDADYWSKYKADKLCVSQQSILDQWAAKRDASCDFGHFVHNYAESLLGSFVCGHDDWESCFQECRTPNEYIADQIARNSIPDSVNTKAAHSCMSGVLSAYRNLRIDPIEAEKQVCDPWIGIAGTVDLVCNSTNNYGYSLPTILDWKTNQSIDLSNSYGDTMFPPLSHLDDCNFNHYALQLNVYRFIMARRYDFHAERMVLVWLTGDRDETGLGYQLIEVPIMETEVALMLSAWQRIKRNQ